MRSISCRELQLRRWLPFFHQQTWQQIALFLRHRHRNLRRLLVMPPNNPCQKIMCSDSIVLCCMFTVHYCVISVIEPRTVSRPCVSGNCMGSVQGLCCLETCFPTAGNSTREDIPVQSSSTTVEGSSMDVDLPEPTEVARSPVYPEAQPIPDAGSLTVESRDGRASGGSTAADTNSLAPKPEPVKSSSPEALKSSSSEDSKSVQNQAKTVVKQGNGKKTTLRREPSGGTKPVKVRTGPFLLQVRLTNGETIQGTFESYQLLRDVKNFIDLQRTDGSMEFRLAIPFPRKLFSEEDMDKTLSKLDIGPRSALILIASDNPTGNPSHSRASANSDADSSSQSEATTAGGSYVGKFLSFLSPYVYGRPAAPQQTPASHSNASPATTRALQEGAQPPMSNSSRPEPPFVTPMNAGSNQENTTLGGRLSHRRGGGANVHTLRGGDEEGPSPGNTYWNGNSTQFGGNDEAKED
ncbi:hypothetical protein M758_12G130700 [Ceratodon purpureus]|nr:hypothetical protein M758_12G130700 [Ceratodon purpureus]KAG0599136.1 hypothetical protein M758_12G130700 [Ceratodon purpureus]KAG0599139.1 hypothetical protein M758_12G130700 [Ceratodon purpureus]